jgi:hypothetical protein
MLMICLLFQYITVLCYVGPSHHCMARPRVAVGGDGVQVWRVAVNILNNQSWTADKGSSSSLRVG